MAAAATIAPDGQRTLGFYSGIKNDFSKLRRKSRGGSLFNSDQTGQITPTSERRGHTMTNLAVGDTQAFAPGNTHPAHSTKENLIYVPCLNPSRIRNQKRSSTGTVSSSSSDESKKEKKKRWWDMASMASKSKRVKDDDFVVKRIAHDEYLKHYAKDSQGNYIGSEAPASDCILRPGDLAKWRAEDVKVIEQAIEDTKDDKADEGVHSDTDVGIDEDDDKNTDNDTAIEESVR